MHPEVVVDASVWSSRILSHDSNHATSYQWSETFISKGGILVVPELLLIEIAAVLTRQTNQPQLAKYTVAGLHTYTPMRIIPFDPILTQASVDAAADLRLRAGDTVYVALARQLTIPLVTWDKEQLQRSSAFIETYTPDLYPF